MCVCAPDLEVTGGVDEQVGGFEVTVQHVGRVDVLEASQDLVQEVADVVVAQPLALQQLVQVRLHQGLHDVAAGTQESRRTTGDIVFAKNRLQECLHSFFILPYSATGVYELQIPA